MVTLRCPQFNPLQRSERREQWLSLKVKAAQTRLLDSCVSTTASNVHLDRQEILMIYIKIEPQVLIQLPQSLVSFWYIHLIIYFFPFPPVLLLEHLCSALLYPDEALKASALYVWLQVFMAVGGSSAKSLPVAIRDRVCVLLRQTLANAGSAKLIKNSVGEKKTSVLFIFLRNYELLILPASVWKTNWKRDRDS